MNKNRPGKIVQLTNVVTREVVACEEVPGKSSRKVTTTEFMRIALDASGDLWLKCHNADWVKETADTSTPTVGTVLS